MFLFFDNFWTLVLFVGFALLGKYFSGFQSQGVSPSLRALLPAHDGFLKFINEKGFSSYDVGTLDNFTFNF